MLPKISDNKKINICGCKLIEIPFLRENLSKGSSLIVGEREGHEGVVSTVLEKLTEEDIFLTDCDGIEEESLVEKLVLESRVKFLEANFLDYPEDRKFKNIVCINVLEHFGMCWGDKGDILHWNWDLKGLQKMMDICDGRIILTVPAGPPIFFGDTLNSGKPFLRRYDNQRMEIIRSLVKENGFKFSVDKLFFSPNLVKWKEVGFDILTPQYANSYLSSPNLIWGVVIEKNG